jgi:hypothetical protein
LLLFNLVRWWRGDAAEVSVFEPVAVFQGDDVGVVDEAVDHGGGDDVVAEDLAPAAERFARPRYDIPRLV